MYPLDEAAGRRDAGSKAERLARARALGLLVPNGFVVPPDDEVDSDELARRIDWLMTPTSQSPPASLYRSSSASASQPAARFAVRSSADVEDRPGATAAGVFSSCVDVPREAVAEAIATVRDSALAEPARAYLAARGRCKTHVRMSVLVQPMVAARVLGVLHTAPLVDEFLLAEERDPGEPEWGEVTPRRVRLDEDLAVGARRLAALCGGEADVEYALTEGEVVFLQARPLAATPAPREPQAWVEALAAAMAAARARDAHRPSPLPAAEPCAEWVRDAEHNPEPLSLAQASLVELSSERAGLGRQRVVRGYLYLEERARPAFAPRKSAAELRRFFAERIVAECERHLLPLESAAADPSLLEAALSAFPVIVQCSMGELGPSLRGARKALDELLQSSIGESLARHGALLAGTGARSGERDAALFAIGRVAPGSVAAGSKGGAQAVGARDAFASLLQSYLAHFGAYAPVWDVAVAPDDEAPERVIRMAALVARGPSPEVRHHEALSTAEAEARTVSDRLPPSARTEFARRLEEARTAQELAEDDDGLFFRAQRMVRRPLRALGEALFAAGRLDDATLVFDATIDEARSGVIDATRARAARALRLAARGLAPPSRFSAGVPRWRALAGRRSLTEESANPGSAYGSGGGVLAGSGTSGRGYGRVFRLLDPSAAPDLLPPGAVLVTAAILPSLTYLIAGAAALVTDYGGALSHAATLAREYGVPAVLGTGGATNVLRDGEELIVDADAGKVYRIGS